MKYGLDIQQRVRHAHSITIETNKTEDEVNKIIEELEKKSVMYVYSFDDMVQHFKEQGCNVVDDCEDEDGTVTDVEVWVG